MMIHLSAPRTLTPSDDHISKSVRTALLLLAAPPRSPSSLLLLAPPRSARRLLPEGQFLPERARCRARWGQHNAAPGHGGLQPE